LPDPFRGDTPGALPGVFSFFGGLVKPKARSGWSLESGGSTSDAQAASIFSLVIAIRRRFAETPGILMQLRLVVLAEGSGRFVIGPRQQDNTVTQLPQYPLITSPQL
jgi:hypothetical protein